jgi:hypothetical protein
MYVGKPKGGKIMERLAFIFIVCVALAFGGIHMMDG